MRRVALLTTTFVLLMAAGGCRHDGRTLRPARADQTGTVSTTPVTTPASLVDPDAADSTAAALSTNAVSTTAGAGASTSVAATATLPPTDSGLIATAPWRDGGAIDPRYTCDGVNVAPALSWSAAPAGTVEIAITLTDLDAPDFAHWAIAGLEPATIALNEDTVPLGAYEATNGAGDIGYTGPCPPAGSEHEYRLTVHYLGSATGLDDGVSAADLLVEIEARETASADVTGTFGRG